MMPDCGAPAPTRILLQAPVIRHDRERFVCVQNLGSGKFGTCWLASDTKHQARALPSERLATARRSRSPAVGGGGGEADIRRTHAAG